MRNLCLTIVCGFGLGPVLAQDLPGTITIPESMTIRPEVQQLENSMANLSGLISSLGKANVELKAEFEAFLANPNDELIASSLEVRMASFAGNVVKSFDAILADQDVLLSSFRLLRLKLGNISKHLERQAEAYESKLGDREKEVEQAESELIKLAVEIRESQDEEAVKSLKRKFASAMRRFKLKKRYHDGYKTLVANYRKLSENIGQLSAVYGDLQDHFVDLIENLENEKEFLVNNINIQADAARIKQIIRDGFFYGNHAIKDVSEKLALLYNQVDTFTKVHERINVDLYRFVESQQVLSDITGKIDSIGASSFETIGDDLDTTINQYYEKRHELYGRD